MRTRNELKWALLDMLGHANLDFIKADTGLPDKRCEEIYAIYEDLCKEPPFRSSPHKDDYGYTPRSITGCSCKAHFNEHTKCVCGVMITWERCFNMGTYVIICPKCGYKSIEYRSVFPDEP